MPVSLGVNATPNVQVAPEATFPQSWLAIGTANEVALEPVGLAIEIETVVLPVLVNVKELSGADAPTVVVGNT